MSDENAPNRGGYNMWWFVAAGVLFLVIVALVAIIIVGHGGGKSTPAAAPTHSQSSPNKGGTSPDPVSDKGRCGLPAGEQNIPLQGPAAVWKTNQYLRYPTSTTFGPVNKPGTDAWGCFQHSQTGALFAAINFMSGVVSPNHEAVINEGAVDNSARAAFLNSDPSTFEQNPSSTAQLLGYQFVEEKPDADVINLWLGEANVNGSLKLSTVWDASADNWKIDLATSDVQGQQIQNTSAFTPWTAAGQ